MISRGGNDVIPTKCGKDGYRTDWLCVTFKRLYSDSPIQIPYFYVTGTGDTINFFNFGEYEYM